MTDETEEPRPTWEPLFAAELVGCTVLIGLTFCNPAGEPERLEQLHGVVVEADEIDGFLVRLAGPREGDTYRLPPHPGAFARARPGLYRLRATGEELVDPDFISTWTITAPADG